MQKLQNTRKMLAPSILSLSLLTVMAGAAVAPALGVIRDHFSDSSPMFIQMIISIPALFIVITSFCFPALCRIFRSRTLVLTGLLFYTAGGVAAGVCGSIALLLITRALVGIGVGIIMPLSTGLLSFYFSPQRQEALMGYSSAMNQMGGVIATLLSGLLANIVWRASFLVYLLGLLSIVLCAVFLPSDNIAETETDAEKRKKGDGKAFASENVLSEEKPKNSGITAIFKENYPFVIAMFLLMTIFFIYPANYAMETAAEGQIPQKYVAAIMAWADFIAFFGGLAFVAIKRIFGRYMKFAAPVCFLTGYILLSLHEGFAGAIAGSFLIGLANGTGIPFIISAVSIKNGKTAATTVMPLISAALYLAQFLCPFLMSAVTSVFGAETSHLPYRTAAVLSVVFLLWSALIREAVPASEKESRPDNLSKR